MPTRSTADQVAFFEQRVRPLLIARCYQCHSEEKKVNGGLRLDARRGLIEGGDSGPAVSPGKPDESLLVKAVRYADADLQMPPDGKLPAAELAVLEEWVRIGAPDPRTDSAGSEKTGRRPRGGAGTLGLSAAPAGRPSNGRR